MGRFGELLQELQDSISIQTCCLERISIYRQPSPQRSARRHPSVLDDSRSDAAQTAARLSKGREIPLLLQPLQL